MQEEIDRFSCPVRGWHGGVIANERLIAGRLAPRLRTLVFGERLLEAIDGIGRDPAQPLLVAADRRDHRDHAVQAAIGRTQDDRMAPRVTGTPQADSFGVDLGSALQKRDGASPVGDLPPGIHVLAGLAATAPEATVVM